MVGGDADDVAKLQPFFDALKPAGDSGFVHAGAVGAGHFAKMVHNGIEYGLMQAYAEGFDILRGAAGPEAPAGQKYTFNLPEIAEVWRRGSVVSSWLLDLTAKALQEDPEVASFTGHVSDSGEGRWTVLAAIDESVPAHVLASALYERFSSRGEADYADKLLSALRKQFGGHVEQTPPS
jgi:6-phosphogluconate dehydrogenase